MTEVLKTTKEFSINKHWFKIITELHCERKRLQMRAGSFTIKIVLIVREYFKTLITFDWGPWTTFDIIVLKAKFLIVPLQKLTYL